MFLKFLDSKEGKDIAGFARESSTFNAFYEYWRDALFERVMRLFVWENTGEVPAKEIEQRLILKGHCGITKMKGELTAMFGTFHGVTKYMDEWKEYTVRSPIYADNRKIEKDIVVINNNALRNPTYEIVHHYSIMLAHNEVTLVNMLVNARDSGGVPIATTEKQKRSILGYLGKLFNGQYGVVTDLGSLGINYAGSDRKTAQSIMDIMEVREKLIKSFYSDIGVRSAFEKRNNTIVAEVEADTSLLLLNLSDMIDCRERGCEEVNKMFGTNWSVHVAKEIDYNTENERMVFSNQTEIHVKENEDEVENSK
jgi:hypothetical protein